MPFNQTPRPNRVQGFDNTLSGIAPGSDQGVNPVSGIKHAAVVSKLGRQPVIPSVGRGLGSADVPRVNAPHVTNPFQRKKG